MAENTNSSIYVVDASYILAGLLPDEHSDEVDKIFGHFAMGEILFESTYLLPFEIANAISLAVRRKRIKSGQAEKFIESFLNWNIKLDGVQFKEVLKVSLDKGITVYDASYLWLSRNKKVKLLTLDEKLQKLGK